MQLNLSRRRLAVIVGLIVAVLVAGVVVITTEGSSDNSATAASTTSNADTVSVSGTGSVEGVPDTLVASFRVHDMRASVQDALNASAIDARKLVAKLRSDGVVREDIKSTDVSLEPDYDDHGHVDGYNSSESYTVHITPLSKVGAILSAATTATGDNSVSINGLSFDIADNTTLLAQARRAAFVNARTAANQYAVLGGRKLGQVMKITAVVHNPTPVIQTFGKDTLSASAGASTTAAVPIQPGQKKVSVTVSVIWALS